MYEPLLTIYEEQRKGTPLAFFADSPVKPNHITSSGKFF